MPQQGSAPTPATAERIWHHHSGHDRACHAEAAAVDSHAPREGRGAGTEARGGGRRRPCGGCGGRAVPARLRTRAPAAKEGPKQPEPARSGPPRGSNARPCGAPRGPTAHRMAAAGPRNAQSCRQRTRSRHRRHPPGSRRPAPFQDRRPIAGEPQTWNGERRPGTWDLGPENGKNGKLKTRSRDGEWCAVNGGR